MATRAYFMINVGKDRVGKDGGVDVVRELKAIPGVKAVEPVFGVYDLLVTVEAPVSEVTHSVNKIMEKGWVRRLHILRRDPVEQAEIEKGRLSGAESVSVPDAILEHRRRRFVDRSQV